MRLKRILTKAALFPVGLLFSAVVGWIVLFIRLTHRRGTWAFAWTALSMVAVLPLYALAGLLMAADAVGKGVKRLTGGRKTG